MGYSMQEYWSGLHFLPQGIFLTQDQSLVSTLQTDILLSKPPITEASWQCPGGKMMLNFAVDQAVESFIEAGAWKETMLRAELHSITLYCCCSCSGAQLCPALRDLMGFSTPSFPVPRCLPEFAQTHVSDQTALLTSFSNAFRQGQRSMWNISDQ